MSLIVAVALHSVQFLCTGLLTAAFVRLALRPSKRDTRIGKLEADYDDLHTRVQRLAGRIGRQKQQELLADESASDDMRQRSNESAADWKARVRLQIAQGRGPNHKQEH
jgi:hypothetical protein